LLLSKWWPISAALFPAMNSAATIDRTIIFNES
jgi:hypothetical protein